MEIDDLDGAISSQYQSDSVFPVRCDFLGTHVGSRPRFIIDALRRKEPVVVVTIRNDERSSPDLAGPLSEEPLADQSPPSSPWWSGQDLRTERRFLDREG